MVPVVETLSFVEVHRRERNFLLSRVCVFDYQFNFFVGTLHSMQLLMFFLFVEISFSIMPP